MMKNLIINIAGIMVILSLFTTAIHVIMIGYYMMYGSIVGNWHMGLQIIITVIGVVGYWMYDFILFIEKENGK